MSLSIQRFCCASSSCATRWVWGRKGCPEHAAKENDGEACVVQGDSDLCIMHLLYYQQHRTDLLPFLEKKFATSTSSPTGDPTSRIPLSGPPHTVKSGIKESVQLDTVHRRSPERLLVGFHKELVFWTKIIEQLVRARDFGKTSNQGAVIHTPDVEVKVALLFYAVE